MEISSQPSTVSRIFASNYRSIAELDLELGPLTILVGPNGAGKSNVVDVLRFLRDCLKDGLDQALIDREGINGVRRHQVGRGRPFDVTVGADFSHGSWIEGVYAFTLSGGSDAKNHVKWEHIEVSIPDAQHTVALEMREGKIVRADGIKSPHIPSKYAAEHLFLGTTDSVFRISDALIRSTINALPSYFPDLLVSLERAGFYNIPPGNLLAPQRVSKPSPLAEDGSNLVAALRGLRKSHPIEAANLTQMLGRLVEGVRGYRVQTVGGYLAAQLVYEGQKGKSGRRMDLVFESDGTLRLLGILMALYQQPSLPLVVIEEPETNIHVGALGLLADAIEEVSTRTQVIVTTHSPDLIDRFSPEVLRVVEKVDGETVVGPVRKGQREAVKQKLFSTGDLMRMEGLQREEA